MSANGDVQEKGRSLNFIRWILIIFFLVIVIVGNYYFQQYSRTLRIIAIIFFGILFGGVTLWITKGKRALTFIREARIEMRKVVWPTHQETLQTTLIIMIATVIIALILLGLDGMLVRLVSFIIGLRF